MKEVTVTDGKGNVIVRAFEDKDGSVKAIIKDNLFIYVDGKQLKEEEE